jgi:hypothetical protein
LAAHETLDRLLGSTPLGAATGTIDHRPLRHTAEKAWLLPVWPTATHNFADAQETLDNEADAPSGDGTGVSDQLAAEAAGAADSITDSTTIAHTARFFTSTTPPNRAQHPQIEHNTPNGLCSDRTAH